MGIIDREKKHSHLKNLLLSFVIFSAVFLSAQDLSPKEALWKVSDPGHVKFESVEPAIRLENGALAWQMLELEPGTRYELSFLVRGEGISEGKNQGARIVFNAGKKWRRITTQPDNKPDTGTFDWRKGTGILDTAEFPSSVIRFELNLTGEGTVWFSDLKLVKKGPSAAKPEKTASFHQFYGDAIRSAALVPQGIFGFFTPDEPVRVRLLLDGTAQNYEYTLRVTDDTGKTVYTQERKPLTEDEILLPGQKCGYYVVQSDVYADGQMACTIQGGFAVSPMPGKRDPFFQFGFGALPDLHDGYKRVGCGSIALKLDWLRAYSSRSSVKRAADYLVNVAYKPFLESGDFHLVADLGTSIWKDSVRTPEEAERGMPLLKDEMLEFYTDFLAEIAPRIKVKDWSVGQETDSNAIIKHKYAGTWSEAMAQLVVMVRIASRQLKKFDPEIRIYAGGSTRFSDVEPLAMGDLVNDFDVYYFDGYTGQWDLTHKQASIPEVNLMKHYRQASQLSVSLGKGRYIANNESGFSIPYGSPFDAGLAVYQAQLTARSLIISRAAPVLWVQLFRPNDYTRDPGDDASMHMATVWKTIPVGKKLYRVPLPGGAMYATAASELAFVKFEAELITGGVYSYIFSKPDGSTLVTIWNIEEKQPFALDIPAGSRVLNTYGRDLTGQPLEIGPGPLFITVPQPAAKVKPFIEKAIYANIPEFKCAATPETVWVRSLVRDTREVEIRLPGQEPLKTKILPGKTSAIPMTVTGPGKLIAGTREYAIPLENVPSVSFRRVTDPAQLNSLEPEFLRVPDHVRPLEALRPELCYFRNEGFNPNGHDISAKYRLGYDDRNFYMSVEVDDPVHLQRHTGKEIWKDDCLQFVLSPEVYPPSSMLLPNEKKPASEYNFGLALTPKGVQLVKFGGKDAGIKDYPAKVEREGNTTRYEVTIPWSAVGGKAKRFGFLVFDNNNPAQASSPYRLELTPGIAGGQDSSKLAKVVYE